MKIFSVGIVLTVFSLSSSMCSERDAEIKEVTFSVAGMTCTGCEKAIEMKTSKLEGVKSVEADYKNGRTIVKFDRTQININEILKVIEDLNFQVSLN